jgi:hypothetical protein
MSGGTARRLAVLALAPILLAASDPEADVAGCRGGRGSGAPDLVDAHGEIVELGTSARWTLTFAEPVTVPDGAGHPVRVDIAIMDPDVPTYSFAYFHDVNRLVRVDATIDHETEIYLLPERGASVFNPPVVEDTSITIQVPGRTLSEDEDLTGTSPGLEALRWTVVVRDGRACDFLGEGDGRPTERLVAEPSTTSPSPAAPAAPAAPSPLRWLAAAAGVAVLGFVGYVVRRAR